MGDRMLSLLLCNNLVRGKELANTKKKVTAKNLKYSDSIVVVEKAIVPSYRGRVRYQGVSWAAQCEKDITFLANDRVLVVGRKNITLIVEPLNP